MKIYVSDCLSIQMDFLKNLGTPFGFIREHLEIPNEEKARAIKEMRWGARDMPDYLKMWWTEDNMLCMPRGFLATLILELDQRGVKWTLVDHRAKHESSFSDCPPITLRPHQDPAVEAILAAQQGIYEAPPASGKTVTVLETIRRAERRSLILVEKKNIASQWKDRCETFLGFSPGFIGDGVWFEADITVALLQTLHARREDLAEWWSQWGLVCLDECHHVTADTYGWIMNEFPAQYRFGVSATPKREDWTYPIATNIIGPVIHRTEKDELQGGVLTQPGIRVVDTGFDFNYRPTQKVGKRVIRNNYTKMVDVLVQDEDRNDLILEHLVSEAEKGHACLVLSRRLKHLELLRAGLLERLPEYPDSRAVMLTGKESLAERDQIAADADEGNMVIFSTIADEALDIPRLDRLFLTFPTAKSAVIRQQIGRVERVHPDKVNAVIYDFCDTNVGILRNQFRNRVREVYRSEGLELSSI